MDAARVDAPPVMRDLLRGYSAVPVEAGESGCVVTRLTASDRPELYLKHGSGRFAADVVDEVARLEWLAGKVLVPAIRCAVAEPEQAWLLSDALPGRSADAWFAAEPDALPRIVDLSADFLRDLHALPIRDCPFDAGHRVRMAAARVRIDAGLVEEDDFDDDHAGWSAERVWQELVVAQPDRVEPVVAHGDFSMGNILLDDGRVTGMIDVGRVGVADRYQDLAIFWQNLTEHGPELRERFLRRYGIGRPDEARLRFHRLLDELF